MRIGTYNVLGLRGFPATEAEKELGDRWGERSLSHFAHVFAGLECDVLALQEGVAFPPIQRIARQLGVHLAIIPSPMSWPGHLLSKLPILETRVFSHCGPEAGTKPLSRCAGACLLQTPSGRHMWVLNLHLHPSLPALREEEAGIVIRRLDELMETCDRAIVLGDFNCNVEEPIHESLRTRGFVNVMESVGGGIQPTMDTAGVPPSSPDHIYLSPALQVHLTSAYVVRAPGFRAEPPLQEGEWVNSDHLPVIAELA